MALHVAHHHGWDVAMSESRFPVFRPPGHVFFTDAA